MALDTNISREEFDRRLERSTRTMSERAAVLEAQGAELEDLLGGYSAVLERLEADAERVARRPEQERSELRELLQDLATRTAAVAASL